MFEGGRPTESTIPALHQLFNAAWNVFDVVSRLINGLNIREYPPVRHYGLLQ